MILFWGRGAELDFERKVSGYMRKLMAVFFVVIMMCNCMAVKATEAKEIPFKITQLEDDPAADKPDYEVHINRAQNFTVVYAQDAMGEFTVPVIKFTNSTGRNNWTPLGSYTIYEKYSDWKLMKGNVYTQGAVRFNHGVMSHSGYYYSMDKGSLAWKEFNKLGQQASSGCVRSAAIDSLWIYNNCKLGTPMIVYDDPNDPGPFGELHTVKIPEDSPYRGWDPTDPDPENPWREVRPILHLTSNGANGKVLTLPLGSSIEDVEARIGLFTSEGVPYTTEDYDLEIYGIYDLSTPGQYELYVRGFDLATTLRADETFVLQVIP